MLTIQGIKRAPRAALRAQAASTGRPPARFGAWRQERAARVPVMRRPLVTWPATSSSSSVAPVLRAPSWPQRPREPSHGDLLDHTLSDMDVIPLHGDSCRLTTHVLVVLPVLKGRTDSVLWFRVRRLCPGVGVHVLSGQPSGAGGSQPRPPSCLGTRSEGKYPG